VNSVITQFQRAGRTARMRLAAFGMVAREQRPRVIAEDPRSPPTKRRRFEIHVRAAEDRREGARPRMRRRSTYVFARERLSAARPAPRSSAYREMSLDRGDDSRRW